MTFDRREFLKVAAGGTLLTAFPSITFSAPELMKKKGQRVVIVGAGFGGATCAKYLRMWSDKKIEVVLVERSPTFISCPMSNTVIGGSRSMQDITHQYKSLGKKYGIKLIQGEVVAIDTEKQTVNLAKGYLKYDRLVVAPGIDLMYDQIEGLSQKIADEQIPTPGRPAADRAAQKATRSHGGWWRVCAVDPQSAPIAVPARAV